MAARVLADPVGTHWVAQRTVLAMLCAAALLAGAHSGHAQSALEPLLVTAHQRMERETGPFAFYEIRAITHDTVPERLVIECLIKPPGPFSGEFHELRIKQQNGRMETAGRELKAILLEELDDDPHWDERLIVRFLAKDDQGIEKTVAELRGAFLRRLWVADID